MENFQMCNFLMLGLLILFLTEKILDFFSFNTFSLIDRHIVITILMSIKRYIVHKTVLKVFLMLFLLTATKNKKLQEVTLEY